MNPIEELYKHAQEQGYKGDINSFISFFLTGNKVYKATFDAAIQKGLLSKKAQEPDKFFREITKDYITPEQYNSFRERAALKRRAKLGDPYSAFMLKTNLPDTPETMRRYLEVRDEKPKESSDFLGGIAAGAKGAVEKMGNTLSTLGAGIEGSVGGGNISGVIDKFQSSKDKEAIDIAQAQAQREKDRFAIVGNRDEETGLTTPYGAGELLGNVVTTAVPTVAATIASGGALPVTAGTAAATSYLASSSQNVADAYKAEKAKASENNKSQEDIIKDALKSGDINTAIDVFTGGIGVGTGIVGNQVAKRIGSATLSKIGSVLAETMIDAGIGGAGQYSKNEANKGTALQVSDKEAVELLKKASITEGGMSFVMNALSKVLGGKSTVSAKKVTTDADIPDATIRTMMKEEGVSTEPIATKVVEPIVDVTAKPEAIIPDATTTDAAITDAAIPTKEVTPIEGDVKPIVEGSKPIVEEAIPVKDGGVLTPTEDVSVRPEEVPIDATAKPITESIESIPAKDITTEGVSTEGTLPKVDATTEDILPKTEDITDSGATIKETDVPTTEGDSITKATTESVVTEPKKNTVEIPFSYKKSGIDDTDVSDYKISYNKDNDTFIVLNKDGKSVINPHVRKNAQFFVDKYKKDNDISQPKIEEPFVESKENRDYERDANGVIDMRKSSNFDKVKGMRELLNDFSERLNKKVKEVPQSLRKFISDKIRSVATTEDFERLKKTLNDVYDSKNDYVIMKSFDERAKVLNDYLRGNIKGVELSKGLSKLYLHDKNLDFNGVRTFDVFADKLDEMVRVKDDGTYELNDAAITKDKINEINEYIQDANRALEASRKIERESRILNAEPKYNEAFEALDDKEKAAMTKTQVDFINKYQESIAKSGASDEFIKSNESKVAFEEGKKPSDYSPYELNKLYNKAKRIVKAAEKDAKSFDEAKKVHSDSVRELENIAASNKYGDVAKGDIEAIKNADISSMKKKQRLAFRNALRATVINNGIPTPTMNKFISRAMAKERIKDIKPYTSKLTDVGAGKFGRWLRGDRTLLLEGGTMSSSNIISSMAGLVKETMGAIHDAFYRNIQKAGVDAVKETKKVSKPIFDYIRNNNIYYDRQRAVQIFGHLFRTREDKYAGGIDKKSGEYKYVKEVKDNAEKLLQSYENKLQYTKNESMAGSFKEGYRRAGIITGLTDAAMSLISGHYSMGSYSDALKDYKFIKSLHDKIKDLDATDFDSIEKLNNIFENKDGVLSKKEHELYRMIVDSFAKNKGKTEYAAKTFYGEDFSTFNDYIPSRAVGRSNIDTGFKLETALPEDKLPNQLKGKNVKGDAARAMKDANLNGDTIYSSNLVDIFEHAINESIYRSSAARELLVLNEVLNNKSINTSIENGGIGQGNTKALKGNIQSAYMSSSGFTPSMSRGLKAIEELKNSSVGVTLGRTSALMTQASVALSEIVSPKVFMKAVDIIARGVPVGNTRVPVKDWLESHGVDISMRDATFDMRSSKTGLKSSKAIFQLDKAMKGISDKLNKVSIPITKDKKSSSLGEMTGSSAISFGDNISAQMIYIANFLRNGGDFNNPTKSQLDISKIQQELITGVNNPNFKAEMFKPTTGQQKVLLNLMYLYRSFLFEQSMNMFNALAYGKDKKEVAKIASRFIVAAGAFQGIQTVLSEAQKKSLDAMGLLSREDIIRDEEESNKPIEEKIGKFALNVAANSTLGLLPIQLDAGGRVVGNLASERFLGVEKPLYTPLSKDKLTTGDVVRIASGGYSQSLDMLSMLAMGKDYSFGGDIYDIRQRGVMEAVNDIMQSNGNSGRFEALKPKKSEIIEAFTLLLEAGMIKGKYVGDITSLLKSAAKYEKKNEMARYMDNRDEIKSYFEREIEEKELKEEKKQELYDRINDR